MSGELLTIIAIYLIWLGVSFNMTLEDGHWYSFQRKTFRVLVWILAVPLWQILIVILWGLIWLFIPEKYCIKFRDFLRRPWGWKQISAEEYKLLYRVVTGAKDYKQKDGKVDEGNYFKESDWDAGIACRDTFSRQDGDVVDYQQRPLPNTVTHWAKIRQTNRGVQVKLIKEGLTQPCNGAIMDVSLLVGGGTMEFVGPSVKVVFRHSGTLSRMPILNGR